jgi:hypothetical protein
MTAFQQPLEKGWLRTALRDVREEVDGWTNRQRIQVEEAKNTTLICQDDRKMQDPQ